MAASDPTPYVATPTGTLQGVAAFSWDGSAWQPSGRAGPDVATPTGVLRGVAAFNGGGPTWQPAGRAQPGVATSTGVLDGVAVYTWSGSAWTPTGGTATPATSTGVLRGVAAFNWDGTAWQPAGQARPSVQTPYGVLDGVAMFGWTGSAWAAVGAPALSLDFMTPPLDPRITFARASTATYFDSSGTMQTAATNAPRFDYDPATHAARGLLIEEARQNLCLQSSNVATAPWGVTALGASNPTVTANQAIAPDGTLTAARVAYPAVNGAGNYSAIYQGITIAASTTYTFSIWARGAVGGETIWFYNGLATGLLMVLTTSWQRFVQTVSSGGSTSVFPELGIDLRDGTQTATSAQTIYAWGAQIEQGAFPTSYIPTTAAAVTRSADSCVIQPVNMGWFTAPGGSWMAEFISLMPSYPGATRVLGYPVATGKAPLYITGAGLLGIFDTIGAANTGAAVATNAISKGASTWASPNVGRICLNGGAVGLGATLTSGFGDAASVGLAFLQTGTAAQGLSGYIRRMRYWPRVLSDAEMQSVTA